MSLKKVPSTNVGMLPGLRKSGLQKARVQIVLIHRKTLLPGSPENREISSSQADGCSSTRRENTARTSCSIICLTDSRKICRLREKGKKKKKAGYCRERTKGRGVVILLCQTYIWYTLNKLSPPPSSCYSAHTKCSLKSLSLNLATLEDAQLAPHTGHQTALCTWNLSSTKLAGLGQGKAPSGAHGAPWPALGSWSPPRVGTHNTRLPRCLCTK